MGLDFTTIADREGTAIYLIHDGSTANTRRMEQIAEVLKAKTKNQYEIFSSREDNGRKVIDFYDLTGSNYVLLVRDDDQLIQIWNETEIPNPDQIAYMANQAG